MGNTNTNNSLSNDSKWHIWASKENNKIEKRASELRKKGHACVLILECYPPRLSWCNKEPCEQKICNETIL